MFPLDYRWGNATASYYTPLPAAAPSPTYPTSRPVEVSNTSEPQSKILVRVLALYETLIKVGWLIGLALGFLFSTCGFGAKSTLMLCSALNLASFALSLVLLKDPLFVFERSLVKIEKAVDFSYRGITLALNCWMEYE